jgi:hypothetical protein
MDSEGTGLLGPADLEYMSVDKITFHLSSAFRARFFDTVQTFDGKIDFRHFLKLYLCLRDMKSPSAVEFFVTVFDLDGDGVVGPADIKYFYHSIVQESGAQKLTLEAYIAEVCDACQVPSPTFGINELSKSGQTRHVISMLIDLEWFTEEEAASVGT